MSKLIFKYSTTAVSVLVKCGKCGGEFTKTPAGEVYGKEYKYCPLCGCKIEKEGYNV